MRTIKINITYLAILLAVVSALAFQSCQKKETFNEAKGNPKKATRSSTTDMQIQHGIFVFSSAEALHQKVNELMAMNEDQLNTFNNSNEDFISLYKQYQIMDVNAENEIGSSAEKAIELKQIANIPDNYFASLVNKDGLLAVGETIYKYNTDNFQTTSIAHLGNIHSFTWANEGLRSYSKGSGNSGNPEWASFPPVSRFFNSYDNLHNWPKSNGRKVRAVHTTWCTWYGVYGSAGGKIRMEKLSDLAGWINIDHSFALNISSSDFRYFALFGSGSGSYWAWDYYTKNGTKATANQHVNEIVLTFKASLIAGPIQHRVNNFSSTVSISYSGCLLNDTWVH